MSKLTDGIDYAGLPEHLHGSVQRYIEYRISPGGFLTAVLSNDLKEALGRADDVNRHLLFEIVVWLYNKAPSLCWGSPERVKAWLNPEDE